MLLSAAGADLPPGATATITPKLDKPAELTEINLGDVKTKSSEDPSPSNPLHSSRSEKSSGNSKGAGKSVFGTPKQLQKYHTPKLQGLCGPCGACLGRTTPTNYMILMQRTYNREKRYPNHNADAITPLFRDHLMPLRKYLYKLPGSLLLYKVVIEDVVGCKGFMNYVDARTKWMDEEVQRGLQSGLTQVVVIAAGYDTRPYRLHKAGVKFFEVDLPQVSEQKVDLVNTVLPDTEKYPRPAYVPADLAVTPLGTALKQHNFDPSKPTVFTCEGIFTYLPQAAVDGLTQQISNLAAPGSTICFDGVHRDVLEGRRDVRGFKFGAKMLAARGEPLLSGFPFDDLPAFTHYWARRGWKITENLDPKAFCAKELPHLKWNDRAVPMVNFISYASLTKQ